MGISNRASVICAVKNVLGCNLGEEAVLLAPSTGMYYSLNEVAAFLWGRMQAPVTFDALVEALKSEYAVDDETCAADVQGWVANLESHGLIEVH